MKNLSKYLATPVLLHYALPALMLYLVAGTVAQKYTGLYEATQMFFSSPIFWLGPVPLPGLPVVLGLIVLNLASKLAFNSPWSLENSGVILTHIGVLLLLLGGLFTALYSNEGYLDLTAGEHKNFVGDYHKREFALLDKDSKVIYALPHQKLYAGERLTIPGTPLKIEILEICRNCKIKKRETSTGSHHGMAQHMILSSSRLEKEDEENMAGLTFSVNGSDDDGIYLVLENVPQLPEINIKNKNYRFILRKQQRKLPFTIELIDFKREMHPGTDIAKTYSSRVLVKDGSTQWESLISMNEPLHYKGYTIFQSSFIATPEGDISVLAVVESTGRAFPYIAGIVMCFGLIVHVCVRKKKGKNAYAP